MNILTVLQEENNFLYDALRRQERLIQSQTMALKENHPDFARNLTKLKKISRQQKEQINVS